MSVTGCFDKRYDLTSNDLPARKVLLMDTQAKAKANTVSNVLSVDVERLNDGRGTERERRDMD
jgi:hypothetical protein